MFTGVSNSALVASFGILIQNLFKGATRTSDISTSVGIQYCDNFGPTTPLRAHQIWRPLQ